MNAYLFLWNPARDDMSFHDYDKVQSDASAGKPYLTGWICPSKKPQPGDFAFVQRTGRENNGIFARGIVTSYPTENDNGTRLVSLKLDSFLPLNFEITREALLAESQYQYAWGPQASGTTIPSELVNTLIKLWQPINNPPVANDNEAPPERIHTFISRIVRDTAAAIALKYKYDFQCQICGIALHYGTDKRYAEVHHLRPLGQPHDGPDLESNMLVLCPNHHALFDLNVPRFKSDSTLAINGVEFKLTLKHKLAKTNIAYYSSQFGRDKTFKSK